MPKKPSFNSARGVTRSGKPIPIIEFAQRNPVLASTLSKTVKSSEERRGTALSDPNSQNMGFSDTEMQRVSLNVTQKIRDAQIVTEMLPDLKMGFAILISSLISPNDMLSSGGTFDAECAMLSTEANAEMLGVIKTFFSTDYKISEKLPKIFDEVLRRSGAYVVAAIPESSIDDVINSGRTVSMEDLAGPKNSIAAELTRPIGWLGNVSTTTNAAMPRTPRLAMESLLKTGLTAPTSIDPIRVNDKFITALKKDCGLSVSAEDFELPVVDNRDFLKAPLLHEKLREQKAQHIHETHYAPREQKFSMSLEDHPVFDELKDMDDAAIRDLIYKDQRTEHKPVVIVRSQAQLSRRTIGAPLITVIPTEAFIPVHVPGDKSKHIGGFVIMDQSGYPINTEEGLTQYNQLLNNMQYGQSSSGGNSNFAMQQNARANFLSNGMDSSAMQSIGLRQREYDSLVDSALVQMLRSGAFPDGAVLSKPEELTRVMFARALSQQRTTILFLPSEVFTYIALDYDANGVGMSLLDESRILNSMRIQTSVANVMASVRNSIGLTKVNVKLDEDEGDPRKIIPAITDMVMAGRRNIMPMGIIDPTDVQYWATRSGLMFSFTGANALPDTSIDYEETNANYAKPDTDLEERLKKQSHAGLGVPTEMIDNADGPEFAAGIVQNQIMFAQKITTMQGVFSPQLSNHTRQIVRGHQVLMDKLRKIILSHYKELKPEFSDDEKDTARNMSKNQLAHLVVNKVLRAWLDALLFKLPAPDSATIKNQQQALEDYGSFVDKGLESYLSTDVFAASIVGETMSSNIDAIKANLKAAAMRAFIVSKNILPELQNIFITTDADENSALNDSNQFINKASVQFVKFLGKRKILSDAIEKASQKIGLTAQDDSTSGGDDTTDTGSENDPFGGFGDDGLGEGDSAADDGTGTESKEADPADKGSTQDDPDASPKTDDAAADSGGDKTPPTEAS